MRRKELVAARWVADVDGGEQAFDEALHGRGVVPAYRVTTDPTDGAFIVIPDSPDLSRLDRARVAGDCRRRFLTWIDSDVDAFADIRVEWSPDLLPVPPSEGVEE